MSGMWWHFVRHRRGHSSCFELRGDTPCGRRRKTLLYGGVFFNLHPLVPITKIIHGHALAENELVRIVEDLLGGVGRGASVSVHKYIIDLTPDDLDGVGGGVCLAEALVV